MFDSVGTGDWPGKNIALKPNGINKIRLELLEIMGRATLINRAQRNRDYKGRRNENFQLLVPAITICSCTEPST